MYYLKEIFGGNFFMSKSLKQYFREWGEVKPTPERKAELYKRFKNDDLGAWSLHKDNCIDLNARRLKFVSYVDSLNPFIEIDGEYTFTGKPKFAVERLTDFSENKAMSIPPKTIAKIHMCCKRVGFITDMHFANHKIVDIIRCNNRFCPFCSKLKSVYDTVSYQAIFDYISKTNDVKFLFLTLTAPNVPGKDLDQEIKSFRKATNDFFKYSEIKNIVLGSLGKLEVTYNRDTDTFHPHMHYILVVDKKYRKGRKDYVSRERMLELWRRAKGDSSIIALDIRTLKNKKDTGISSGILELTKYIAKDSDYLYSEKVFSDFYNGLKGKRMFRPAGIVKDAVRAFKGGILDDYIKDDMIYYVYYYRMYFLSASEIKIAGVKEVPDDFLENIKARYKDNIKQEFGSGLE